VISAIMVVALSGFVVPALTRVFADWITGSRRDDQRRSRGLRFSHVPKHQNAA
jgi:hypothetical protein